MRGVAPDPNPSENGNKRVPGNLLPLKGGIGSELRHISVIMCPVSLVCKDTILFTYNSSHTPSQLELYI